MPSYLTLALGLVAAWAWAQPGSAEAKEPAPTPPRFELTTRTVEIPERGVVTNLVLCIARQAFSFLPPEDWKLGLEEAESKVKWQSPDLSRLLTLKIVPGQTDGRPVLKLDRLRQTVLQRFPGAAVTEEFVCYTSGESGPAFDLRYVVQESFNLCTRVAFVAFPGGEVEFSLTTPAEDFAKSHLVFGNLLNSFKIEPLPSKD